MRSKSPLCSKAATMLPYEVAAYVGRSLGFETELQAIIYLKNTYSKKHIWFHIKNARMATQALTLGNIIPHMSEKINKVSFVVFCSPRLLYCPREVFWTKRERAKEMQSLSPYYFSKRRMCSPYKYRQTNAARWLQVPPVARPSAAENTKMTLRDSAFPRWNRRSERQSNGSDPAGHWGIAHQAFCLRKIRTYIF